MVYYYTRAPKRVWPKKPKEKDIPAYVDVSEFFVDYVPDGDGKVGEKTSDYTGKTSGERVRK